MNTRLDLAKDIIDYSFQNNVSHIPSALSMSNYVYEVSKLIDKDNTNIVIGKPFGALAYYLSWDSLGWFGDKGFEHYEDILQDNTNKNGVSFVEYSEETLGNAMGVACGYALVKDRLTWVNISDATLQMGTTLEALLHISQLSKNGCRLLITVDCNNDQVTGNIDDIISIEPVKEMLKLSNITCVEYNNVEDYFFLEHMIEMADSSNTGAVCIFFNTVKGYPVQRFMNEPVKYHYSKLTETEHTEIMDELCHC